MFTVMVSCGNGTFSPSCNTCPRKNTTVSQQWCEGSCYFDNATKTCEERMFFAHLYQFGINRCNIILTKSVISIILS